MGVWVGVGERGGKWRQGCPSPLLDEAVHLRVDLEDSGHHLGVLLGILFRVLLKVTKEVISTVET